MKYLIARLTAGSPGTIKLDKVQYDLIKSSRQNLLEALYMEEKLDLLTENYSEYEADLLSIATRMMVFHNYDYFSMGQERNLISRRIVNLLSAGRMYLDQSAHHLKNMYGENSKIFKSREVERTQQFEQKLGYRVMEALRNYVQHRGFPIQSMTFSNKRVDKDEDFQLLRRVIPQINISALDEDKKFRKDTLGEMRSVGKKDAIDVRPLIREYVEGIGSLHEKVRELINQDLIIWENNLDDAIIKYKKKFGSKVSLAGLAIVQEADSRKWVETKTLSKEFIKKRQYLETKNRIFINLRKNVASNEALKDD